MKMLIMKYFSQNVFIAVIIYYFKHERFLLLIHLYDNVEQLLSFGSSFHTDVSKYGMYILSTKSLITKYFSLNVFRTEIVDYFIHQLVLLLDDLYDRINYII
jgi:hypothetical protein